MKIGENGFYWGAQLGFHVAPVPLMSIGIGIRYSNRKGNLISSSQETALHSLGGFAEVAIHIQGPERKMADEPFLPADIFESHTTYVISEKDGKEVREAVEVQPGAILGFTSVEFDNVFPVLYKYYEDNPFGKAIIVNNTNGPATDIVVSFYVEEHMSDPWRCAEIGELAPGDEQIVDLFALFRSDILETTERTKVSSKVIVDYTTGNQRMSSESVEPIRLERRSATTWDDDRKAAAYITAGDPSVIMFSNNVSSWIRGKTSGSLNKNFTLGMALFEALRLHGIVYSIDPTTPYEDLSRDSEAIDFLKFPRETLTYLAGDCDDLSILYSSLLESIGIETAFITIPGHIYMAFSLDVSPDKARKMFLDPSSLIFIDGQSWLPVEITKTDSSFLDAWQEGASEWREFSALDQARFFPNHVSWTEYEPVQLPGQSTPIALPDRDELVSAFTDGLSLFVDRELYPQVSDLESRIAGSDNNARYVNRLAILYARYGLLDKAVAEFDRLLQDDAYLPALVNMGNIQVLRDAPKKALEYYERAYTMSPANAKVLLSMTRTHHDLENFGTARDFFTELEKIDSDLAAQYSYLSMRGGESARAANAADIDEMILWVDDDDEEDTGF